MFDPGSARALAAGEVGEIRVRGHVVMQGYYRNAEATAEVLGADGWFRTGDLGSYDEAGYLKITGRLKDMFIVGGFNAYPAEIENLLLRHPQIAQAAVIGVPDARLGEVGMAFVVPTPGASLEADEVFNDNINATSNAVGKQAGFVQLINPMLELRSDWGNHMLNAYAKGGFGLSGMFGVRTARWENASVRDFLGGNAVMSGRIGMTPEGKFTLAGLKGAAPNFQIRSGSGSYDTNGQLAFDTESVECR